MTDCANCKIAKDRSRKNMARSAEDTRVAHVLEKSGLVVAPMRSMGFANFEHSTASTEAAKAACERLADATVKGAPERPWLVVCGRFGTGKTHLGIAMVREVALRKNSTRAAKYICFSRIMDDIKNTYKDGSRESELDVLRDLYDRELLVIDEFGEVEHGKKFTAKELDVLGKLLDERYIKRMATVILTNLDRQQVCDTFGERLFSRAVEIGLALHVEGPNWRLKPRPENKVKADLKNPLCGYCKGRGWFFVPPEETYWISCCCEIGERYCEKVERDVHRRQPRATDAQCGEWFPKVMF